MAPGQSIRAPSSKTQRFYVFSCFRAPSSKTPCFCMFLNAHFRAFERQARKHSVFTCFLFSRFSRSRLENTSFLRCFRAPSSKTLRFCDFCVFEPCAAFSSSKAPESSRFVRKHSVFACFRGARKLQKAPKSPRRRTRIYVYIYIYI